jgi:hypothetical protein
MHGPQPEPNGLDPSLASSVRPAPDVEFALLGDQPTLFSEWTQKLYALNDAAAFIWCTLAEGGSVDVSRDRLVESGIDRATADRHVTDVIRAWLALGLLTTDTQTGPVESRADHSFTVDIGGRRLAIWSTSPRDARHLATLFDQESVSSEPAEDCIRVVATGRSMHLSFNGSTLASCEPDELLPTVKALITEQVVARTRPDIVFHAACLSLGGRSVLVSGPPGAGKTTLALHLADKGFDYAADDITLIGPDGTATGVPFAPTIKSGAWDLVSHIRPDLRNAMVHRRQDGKRVRYLSLSGSDRRSHPIGWIFFIKRTSGEIELRRIGAPDAMRRLIESSFCPGGRLSLAGFGALRRALAGADAFELTYDNSAEAAELIRALCHASA